MGQEKGSLPFAWISDSILWTDRGLSLVAEYGWFGLRLCAVQCEGKNHITIVWKLRGVQFWFTWGC